MLIILSVWIVIGIILMLITPKFILRELVTTIDYIKMFGLGGTIMAIIFWPVHLDASLEIVKKNSEFIREAKKSEKKKRIS